MDNLNIAGLDTIFLHEFSFVDTHLCHWRKADNIRFTFYCPYLSCISLGRGYRSLYNWTNFDVPSWWRVRTTKWWNDSLFWKLHTNVLFQVLQYGCIHKLTAESRGLLFATVDYNTLLPISLHFGFSTSWDEPDEKICSLHNDWAKAYWFAQAQVHSYSVCFLSMLVTKFGKRIRSLDWLDAPSSHMDHRQLAFNGIILRVNVVVLRNILILPPSFFCFRHY